MRRHYAKHSQGDDVGGDKGSCNLCGITMIKNNLYKHYLYKHPESCVCECDICTSQTVDGPRVVKCNICGRRFCWKMILYAHKRVEHDFAENGKHRCKYCHKMFTTNRAKYLHLHKHHGKGVGDVVMGNASVTPVDSESNREHMDRDEKENASTHVIHIGEGQGIQYLPRLSESSLSAVIKELMIVSSDKMCKLPYKCLLCGRCFAKTKYIRLHIRRNHVKDEDQPYRCKICGSGFVRLTEFRKHTRAHSGFRPYKCKICGRAFKQQANLTDHMNIHSTTKEYQCFICKRLFRQRGALNAHINHHDTLKPFTCMYCDKGFTTRGELSRHMQRYDLGEGKSRDGRSFMCHICQDSFSHFPLLLKHIEEHHPERPFQCQVCEQKFAAFNSLYTHKIKAGHFLESEIEERPDSTVRRIRPNKKSAVDVQEAVYTIQEGALENADGTVTDSVFNSQSRVFLDVQGEGKTLEVVIEQFQPEEVVTGAQSGNDNEELLSIARKLTELSTYTEVEASEVEASNLMQEEDEIMKDMLDADHELLANLGKQLGTRREEETYQWQADSLTQEPVEDSNRVEISQGVDLSINLNEPGPEQENIVIEDVSKTAVTEASPSKSLPSNMEELATLIAQNSQVTLGESITAYQVDDGSIIYVCMDQPNGLEEKSYDVATTNEYTEMETEEGLSDMKNQYENQEVTGEVFEMEEPSIAIQETKAVAAEDEDTVDNVESVEGVTAGVSGESLITIVPKKTEMENEEINGIRHEEQQTDSNNPDFSNAAQRVEEYIHDEQTFIKEELIDTDIGKIGMQDMVDVHEDPSLLRYLYNGNQFKCLRCNYTCMMHKTMKKHLKRHTPVGHRQFECETCSKKFVTNCELTRHRYTHTGEKNFECQYCGKRFRQAGHLKDHVRTHLGQKDYSCSECPAMFRTKNQSIAHWNRRHSLERMHCDECGRTFTDKQGLIKHKGAVHSGVFAKPKVERGQGTHQCHICGTSYARSSALQNHLLTHNPDTQPNALYMCEVCGTSFKTMSVLNEHIKLEHSEEKTEICEFCGMAFKLKKQLLWHIRSKHKGPEKKKKQGKVFICGCGKRFASKMSMAYHVGTNEACRSSKVTVSVKQEEPEAAVSQITDISM